MRGNSATAGGGGQSSTANRESKGGDLVGRPELEKRQRRAKEKSERAGVLVLEKKKNGGF